VFTEYRDTLDAIVLALGDTHRVVSIHGGMPREWRTTAVDRFNAGGVDVLVATDAAGEGLNLHHRCRLVIDFELPWNPLRLEQRIGRVDRIGQRQAVHAVRFFHSGTIEQEVLDRLSLRQQRARDDLERVVAERDVAAAVFTGSGMMPEITRALRTHVSVAALSEVTRLEELRRASRHDRHASRCWAAPKRSGTRHLHALLRQTIANSHGIVLGSRLHAIAVTLRQTPRSHREWRDVIDGIPASLTIPERQFPTYAEITRRIAAIRGYLQRDQRREYQRSLFDRRAEDVESARVEDAARLDAALARLEHTLAPPDGSRSEVEVVAAWPGRRA
jgi:superfamily II DNA/RNA helicase